MSPRPRGRPPGSIPEPERSRLLSALRAADKANTALRHAVRDARAAHGSVREIADLLGKSTNTIQRWTRDDYER
ncbi:helix-turn-helix domain-containing protein [Mycobacterium timonense]|uniref:Helix-turn-helix domain-containing protein n=1 Tax=Mycobacterium bouchedurhonense TaxID=701041 RepID=A0AAW5S1J1_MYCBC|nr:helix-turn-helix domain-containing protein [Mycobacterium bouchedurhonense]MCV6993255.1 helix-turn-helix domain-containing protein [Mycobacterium timonense]MDV3306616.1 helix-turn-helix domain-containing protein [Mycobacterium avium subsp. hominissuis]ORA45508.1 hypothetical protein BST19_20005 [Mycobacterium bouchedurhonense]